ncbi:adenylate cyclase [Sinorhizobium fredii USDA 205]|uniref:HAMP domain-containing protein n=1 Tax=Rhizobium fredii TaxID=380 RepID=A0A844ALZ1_RHIFR|nr:adenylate/guanylate cyclase domain-containing protein [Sinorhizobium fredii]AWM27313.1 Adenylate cyclase [Sinorhizobium fredii CCBAU 25509]KSV86416.1 adenylate cyclase [Sinorhizobium fredii USDA 205]MQW98724.1 HAMP domain-containing protein [Sinorhizobium fredii]MQX11990.1 HAMP domain-containing protein [Sinorhizobium fredii]UTY51299.1 adenylate/guanylate cyclase domain-containing protein [Sinorhizobium fredii]
MRGSDENKRLETWTLRSLLSLVMVAVLIVVSATLVGLDYRRARNAAIEDAEANMGAFVDRLVGRLGMLSGDTSALVGLVASVANAFLVPPPERMNDKVALLREGIIRSPHIDGVYVGYPSGAFFHVVDLRSSAWRIALDAPRGATLAVRSMERDDQGRPFDRVLFLDESGLQFAERQVAPAGYDPRIRPWYRAAVNGKAPMATGPYETATTAKLGMTISQAHRGNPKIVIGADVVLDTITDFLSRERLTRDSVSLILDAVGRPIMHSDPTAMRRILATKDSTAPVAVPETDPLVDSIRHNPPAPGKASFVNVGDRTYLAMVTPLESAQLLSGHRVVVAAPLDELMAAANETLVQSLAISGSVVVLAVLFSLVLAHLITKSLNQLTDSANRLQDLDFTTPIDVPSHVTEISTLNNAMNRARDAIFTFALYVPRELVRKGIESGQFTGRSGWRQEVTALFTDIYDFTTISEHHSPEAVVAMLSEYFDIFSEVVAAHDGTIIQFLGDSVFAMWNAPVADPRHAEHACRCALAVEERLEAFNAKQREKGLPEFRTRFGIHTGPAVVGSVGAKERLQYTAMGDTVNVASRLEGMNKDYGTTILASGAVMAQCGDVIAFRPLGFAQAKGRVSALEIYEVLSAAAIAEQPAGEQTGTAA